MRRAWLLATLLLSLLLVACGGGSGGEAGTDTVANPDSGGGRPDVADPGTDVGDPGTDLVSPDDTGGSSVDIPEPEGAFRFAVIADPFVTGNDLDARNDRLEAVVAALNARDDLHFVLLLGDVAANKVDPWHREGPDYEVVDDSSWEEAIDAAMTILGSLDIPLYVAPGDKDYTDRYMIRQFEITWADRVAREQALKDKLGAAFPGDDPWYAFDYGGVHFVAVNTTTGARLEESNGHAGSMGATQMTWLDGELASALPVVVFGHHRADMVVEDSGGAGFGDTLSVHADNVLAVLTGHVYKFAGYNAGGTPGYSMDAVVENPEDTAWFAIAEVDPAAGTFSIVNWDALPVYEPFEMPACEGSALPNDDLTPLTDTVHAMFVTEMDADDDMVAQLLSSADMGETPFVFRVLSGGAGGALDMLATIGETYRPLMEDDPAEGGDHAIRSWMESPRMPCKRADWSFDDPCTSTTVNVTYDLMAVIDPISMFGPSGITLDYTADVDMALLWGEDDETGDLTIVQGTLGVTIEKAPLVEKLQVFLVDVYCANDGDFEFWVTPPMQQEGCNPVENGHGDACNAGTLAFDEVPESCDANLGNLYEVPVRFLLSLAPALPDTVHLSFFGWGHKMVATTDMAVDWAVDPDLFEPWNCDDAPR